MDELSVAIGKNIRRLRKAKKWQQYRLAMEVEATPGVVSNWEVGRCAPSAYYLYQLANVLGCTTDELLGRCEA